MKKATRKSNDRKSSSARKHAGQPQHQQSQIKAGQKQQYGAGGEGKQYGEGSYAGTRQYNKGLKEHMQTHDIEREARDAAPRTTDEAKQMEQAERTGRSRARSGSKGRSPDAPEGSEDLK